MWVCGVLRPRQASSERPREKKGQGKKAAIRKFDGQNGQTKKMGVVKGDDESFRGCRRTGL